MNNCTNQERVEAVIEERFDLIEKIGSGAYGHVWKVIDKKSHKTYALKKVFLAFQNEVDAQRTYREIALLNQLKHPNIVKLYEVIPATNDIDIYLLFQYLESDLFWAIKNDLLNETHRRYIIYQLAKVLKFLKSAGILHRDLKPSNVLLNNECQIKLCDFGLSRTVANSNKEGLTEFITTRWYRAPQVLFGSISYDSKSDVWSLGCLIYEMYASRPLFPGNDTVDQICKVLEFKGYPNEEESKSLQVLNISEVLSLITVERKKQDDYFKYIQKEEVKEFLRHIFEYIPEKRWGFDEILGSELLKEFVDFGPIPVSSKEITLEICENKKQPAEIYREFIYFKHATPVRLMRESARRSQRLAARCFNSLHERGNRKSKDKVSTTLQSNSKSFHCRSKKSLHKEKGSRDSINYSTQFSILNKGYVPKTNAHMALIPERMVKKPVVFNSITNKLGKLDKIEQSYKKMFRNSFSKKSQKKLKTKPKLLGDL